MKKYILIAALIFSAIAANAQYAPKYKELYVSYTPTSNSVAPVAGLSFNLAF
ncbi:MAG: hypothetical protein IKO04_01505 [Bacteroidales bacterium]|nr:hypothetical protein [Bacteroidales bacterium]